MIKKILFRADAKPSIGVGDLISLVNLSMRFEDNGWETFFMIRDYAAAKKIMASHKIDNYKVIPAQGTGDEVAAINSFCRKNNITYLFACITETNLANYRGLSAGLVKGCVNFDGSIPEGWHLVVNWDVGAMRLYGRKDHPGTLFLSGPRYVILPYNFDWDRINKRVFKKNPQSILLVIGGADEFNFTQRLLKILDSLGLKLRVRIILGPGYNFKAGLLSMLKNASLDYEVKENVTDMFEVYMDSDLAISAGGLISSELIASRTPAILLSIYDHQVARCRFFSRKHLAIYLGHRDAALSKRKISRAIESLSQDRLNNKGGQRIFFRPNAIYEHFSALGGNVYN